jgi:hypothetical protein
VAETEAAWYVAVSVDARTVPPETPVTVNVVEVWLAATVTLEGKVAAPVLLLESPTAAPPVGAAALSLTVAVVVPAPARLVWLRVRERSAAAGVTVRPVPAKTPGTPETLALIVAVLTDATVLLVTVTLPDVTLPAAIFTLAGTVATVVSVLKRLTMSPPAGAGALRLTVAVVVAPALTLV